jgi:hypothetical protein
VMISFQPSSPFLPICWAKGTFIHIRGIRDKLNSLLLISAKTKS